MDLEICAANYQSSINAQKAGAFRIELCTNLEVGGLTPKKDIIKQVLEKLTIPVFVLIRPRSGNFVYSSKEFETMKSDILICKNLGCSGIVSGVLNNNNTIDIERTKELVELSHPLAFTFHRAFDEVINSTTALEELIEIGVDRVLTSGHEETAEKGIDLIRKLNRQTRGRITILPGAGINPKNVNIFKQAGLHEIHASASGLGEISKIETIKALLKSIYE